MIESGNVVCVCVLVRVLIEGCSTRYGIIPQIKNSANSKPRQSLMADDKISGWEVRVEHIPLKTPGPAGSSSMLPSPALPVESILSTWGCGSRGSAGWAAMGAAGATGACVLHWCFLPGLVWAVRPVLDLYYHCQPPFQVPVNSDKLGCSHILMGTPGYSQFHQLPPWNVLEKKVPRTVSGGCNCPGVCCSMGRAALLGRDLGRARSSL